MMLSDEATSFASSHFSHHKVSIWGSEHPHITHEHICCNIWHAVTHDRVWSIFICLGDDYRGKLTTA